MRTSEKLRAQAKQNRLEAEALLVKVRLLYVHSALEEAEATLLDEGIKNPTPERIHMEARGERPDSGPLIVRPEDRKEGDIKHYYDVAKNQKRRVDFVNEAGELTGSLSIPWHSLVPGYDLESSKTVGEPYA